jgi:hypothetical protein
MKEERILSEALETHPNRDAPYSDAAWQNATATRHNLEHTLRPRSNPKPPSTAPEN